ncbi:MAG TPA: putative HNHc nuclease [Ligilactobacillus acidipiscis]|uniref:HNHc nuclease n=1 Tax=Ligilactobacillus acidipiscis TaxID=89059 RepID=A0A921F9J7_9LACO|nr:putative HNHc nuclease [Ligilactobacillus acidipiscis]
MWLPAIVSQFVNNKLTVIVEESLNIEHIKTMYGENFKHIFARIEIVDPRKVRPVQRKLFFALLNDIQTWSGAPMKDFLKDFFYTTYAIENDGAEISLADDTKNSVSDANKLLDIVIDFMFEWSVPFKQGYELLPRDENYFLYNCCKYRKCMICGSSDGQMAHYEAVGSEGRKQADHRNKHFWCLCQKHHHEQHNLGVRSFMNKYHIKPIKLSEQTLKDLGVMTRKRMDEIDEEAEHGIN